VAGLLRKLACENVPGGEIGQRTPGGVPPRLNVRFLELLTPAPGGPNQHRPVRRHGGSEKVSALQTARLFSVTISPAFSINLLCTDL
jgi:hypothetical protein